MNILYLKTASRAALIDALTAVGMWTEDAEGERFKPITPGDALDEIGAIYTPTGRTLTVEGIETPEMAPVPGYHANLLIVGEAPDLSAIEIPRPWNPRRVFAGVPA